MNLAHPNSIPSLNVCQLEVKSGRDLDREYENYEVESLTLGRGFQKCLLCNYA